MLDPGCFEEGNVTGERYKRMVRYFLFSKFANCPQDMIFQQDGALLYYANILRQYLDRKIPNRYMGWEVPFPWRP